MKQLSEGTRLFVKEQTDKIGTFSDKERAILDSILEDEETVASFKDLPVTHEDYCDELQQAAFEAFFDGETDPEEWKEQTWQDSYKDYQDYLEAHTYQGMLELACANGNLDVVREIIPHSDPKAGDSRALCWASTFGNLEVVKELLPHSDISNWEEGRWLYTKPEMKQFIETYYERQALNQAIPSVQAPQQVQAVAQSRSRGGRL